MIERDLVELLTALVVISACAAAAVVTASPRGRARGETDARRPEDDIPAPVPRIVTEETSHAGAPAALPATAPPAPGTRARPRILTGEPGEPEARPHPARRAIRFVGGVTALAAGGAIGLLMLVRALVAMFRRIGG